MANISQIHVTSENATYDIEDATARARNIPAGGSTGQVLAKSSGTDYDVGWVNRPTSGGTSFSYGISDDEWSLSLLDSSYQTLDSITMPEANSQDAGLMSNDMYSQLQGMPSGGSSGQVLAKASGTDYDTEWVTGGGGGISLLDVYPVGSIYMSINSTDPGTLFGGTWVQLTETFLLAASAVNAANPDYPADDGTHTTATGGSPDAIVPYHNHSVSAVSITSSGGHTHTITSKYNSTSVANGSYWSRYTDTGTKSTTAMSSIASNTGKHTHSVPAHDTNYAGTSGNTAGANMPPYLVVYMWKRTA